VSRNHTLRVKSYSVGGNRTLRVEISLVRIEITLVRDGITFVLVKITMRVNVTLCVYKSNLLVSKSHSACRNYTLGVEINLIRVGITIVCVVITLVSVKITLFV
jgi:hypothetical protein